MSNKVSPTDVGVATYKGTQQVCNVCATPLGDGPTSGFCARHTPRAMLPYPWCKLPTKCAAKGYCTRNPSCGE